MTSPHPAPRSGGPIIVLGALSFIPGLGFILGSIAVTWGLLSSRRRAWVGVAVGATGALLNLVAGGVLVARLRESPELRVARTRMVKADRMAIVGALDAYRARTGAYPRNLQVLVARGSLRPPVNIFDHGRSLFSVTPYEYHPAADFQSFDLYSVGPDGMAGTGDDLRPELTDSVRLRTGYRPAP